MTEIDRTAPIKVVTEELVLSQIGYGEKGNGSFEYSLTMIIPPSLEKTIKEINSAVAELKPSKNAKGGLRLCSEHGDDYPAGWFFMTASSIEKPGCIDADMRLLEFECLSPGCIARISLDLYPFSVNGVDGVAAGIRNLMLIKEAPESASEAAKGFP